MRRLDVIPGNFDLVRVGDLSSGDYFITRHDYKVKYLRSGKIPQIYRVYMTNYVDAFGSNLGHLCEVYINSMIHTLIYFNKDVKVYKIKVVESNID
jgi:hypothetical protein